MFSKGRQLTRQIKYLEKQQDKILKELRELKEQNAELLESQGHSE